MKRPGTQALNEPAAVQIANQLGRAEICGTDRRTYRLTLTELKPVPPRAGWYYFAVALCEPSGPPSRTPLMMGIVSGGGRGVMPWLEVRLYPEFETADGGTFDARAAGLEQAVLKLCGEHIPDGGHIMIEYESPGQSATHRELLLRVPPAATYLGSLMLRAGFRGAFKDWYISEGGHEGPRKLQANKSPSTAAARQAMSDHLAALREFIKRPLPAARDDAAIFAAAQQRARELLRELAGARSRKKPARR